MIKNADNMILLSERLNQVNFKVPEYDDLLAKMQRQHEAVAVRIDNGQPWAPRNRYPVRGLVVVGHHFSGKSDLVSQCLEAIQPVESGDGQTIEPKTRLTTAPFMYTQSSQARSLLAAMGYPATRKMVPDVAWSKVFDRLDKERLTHVGIDNWHWSFAPSQVGQASKEAEKRKIQAAYCQLLDHPVWPLPLVLIGLPEVLVEIAANGMEHIKDRCDVITIGRMRTDASECARLRLGVEALCVQANLQMSLRDQDLPFQRLIHASDDSRGIAITLAKLAVLAAVRAGSSRLELQHLTAVYAQTVSGRTNEENPFVANDWTNIDPSPITQNVGMMSALMAMNRPTEESVDARQAK